MTATATTAELAAEFDTTPRELRKFLRAEDRGVGKGARYALPATKRDIKSMRTRFNAWQEARDEARNARTAPEPTESDITPDEVTEDEAPISLDDLEGPTEDELLEED